jgi:hypothetical protein
LHVDQGYGETIQFCRYARLLARQTRAVIELPAVLRPLLSSLSDDIDIVTEGDPLPPFGLHCPFVSLPLGFGTTLETIPHDVPYLRADQPWWPRGTRVQAVPGLRVGLAWAGDAGLAMPEATARDRRSIPLTRLARLGQVPGISFISLQKDEAARSPSGMMLHDWSGELNDFADTAALVAALGLVIPIDTSVAHLAGALGAPAWILNRLDARWRLL